MVVIKVSIFRGFYNTLFHYYNTLGGQGVGCKRELWEKLDKSSCLYSKKDNMRDKTFN